MRERLCGHLPPANIIHTMFTIKREISGRGDYLPVRRGQQGPTAAAGGGGAGWQAS